MRAIFLILTFFSCSPQIVGDLKQFKITIIEGQSIKYDLLNNTYTVYFLSKDPYTVKFTLSEDDKKQLLKSIYRWKLDKTSSDAEYQDNCNIQPKIYTVVEIFNEKQFRLKVNPDCNSFKNGSFSVPGKNVVEFINSVKQILKSKPEIATAPFSDIIYM